MKQVYALKAEREKRIIAICPGIPNTSGIYIFFRTDESGIRRAYCGQARHLRERCAAHLGEYDHIALSLKKHGFYSANNPHGWKLQYKTCGIDELDEREVATIKSCADSGMQMYNVTSGSQSTGKMVTGIAKPPKGYRDGLAQGYKNASRDIANLFDKHLAYSPKSEKPNKNAIKAMEKFQSFLDHHRVETPTAKQ